MSFAVLIPAYNPDARLIGIAEELMKAHLLRLGFAVRVIDAETLGHTHETVLGQLGKIRNPRSLMMLLRNSLDGYRFTRGGRRRKPEERA